MTILKKSWSENKFKQAILGEFIDTAEMMFASRVPVLFNSELTLEEVRPGRKYIEGWDLARGRKKTADQTVGFRIDVTELPYKIVKFWAFQLPWTEKERQNINIEAGFQQENSSIEREIRNAHASSAADVFLDSTGLGDTLFGMLQDIAKPVDFRGGKKDEILDHLQAIIDSEMLSSPFITELAEEMTMYQRQDQHLATDFLMALAVACSAIKIVKQRELTFLDVDVFAKN